MAMGIAKFKKLKVGDKIRLLSDRPFPFTTGEEGDVIELVAILGNRFRFLVPTSDRAEPVEQEITIGSFVEYDLEHELPQQCVKVHKATKTTCERLFGKQP